MGRMRVLVVEDNDSLSDAIRRGLLAEGFAVDVISNGLDGLWRAREFPYDVVILDIMLPGMNGYEVCRTLRQERVSTPVMMLTAKDGEYDIAEGLDLGADDYLTKPFSFVVLVARLRALMRRDNPDPLSSVIAVGDVVLDPRRRTCRHHGRAVQLTPREYALLEALARQVDQPLSRSMLLDQVWGPDHAGDSNVVDVYIGYLRKKLRGPVEADSPIETVRGVGYRLVSR